MTVVISCRGGGDFFLKTKFRVRTAGLLPFLKINHEKKKKTKTKTIHKSLELKIVHCVLFRKLSLLFSEIQLRVL